MIININISLSWLLLIRCRFGSVIGDHSVVTSSTSASQAKSDFTKTLANLATGVLTVTYNSTDYRVQNISITDSNGVSQSTYTHRKPHKRQLQKFIDRILKGE